MTIILAVLRIHELIKLRTENGIIETTPGRVIFNTIVPKELGFQNYSLPKKKMSELDHEMLQESWSRAHSAIPR